MSFAVRPVEVGTKHVFHAISVTARVAVALRSITDVSYARTVVSLHRRTATRHRESVNVSATQLHRLCPDTIAINKILVTKITAACIA